MKRSSFAAPFLITAALSPAAFGKPAPKPSLPHADPGDYIRRDADSKCWARHNPECPPNINCNPGPEHEVACEPEGKKPAPPTK